MTLKEIDKKYGKTLWDVRKDELLKRELFTPILSNLYENTVVYHERNTIIAKIEKVVLDDYGVSMFTRSAVTIYEAFPWMTQFLEKPFSFACAWTFLRYGDGCMSPYSGWLLWPDPETVKRSIELFNEGKLREASGLTIFKK